MNCDKCGREADSLKPFPYRYMMNGKYVQYYGCIVCHWEEQNRRNLVSRKASFLITNQVYGTIGKSNG